MPGVEVDPDRFRRVVQVMDDALTSEEASSTRAVLLGADDDPNPARLLRASSWPELRARHEDRWLFEMLDEGRLDVHFQPIVRAVLLTAAELGLDTVAEGLERRKEVDVLRELGCRYGQGYFFAKPMPADDMEEMI